ncbi:hypothetical protein Pmani_035615 [Petrolisthes manimaculis]|uniref:Uncharacterized protein n=1 Tax=Petrolisthes manimaculis TaxID=1843537 RepID=A0AAE1NK75_9EUCA|nr:hypothetical protein Pmani_035615 [Petrolisthes manimaculis]
MPLYHQQQPRHHGRNERQAWSPNNILLVAGIVVFLLLVSVGEGALVVKCPTQPSSATQQQQQQQTSTSTPPPPNYCNCTRMGPILSIKCDFQNKEAIKLTRGLLQPFLTPSLKSTYVRMKSTKSIYVTSQFMQAWHEVPSSAFDVWHGGNVTLESSPAAEVPMVYNTTSFAGVGIVGCNITEIPARFLRDRQRGGFRIKSSNVGVIRAGFIHKIKEMRYIVLEKSVVDVVEGSVASEGFVTLSQRSVHSWSGLLITNTSFGVLAAGAFNLTHHSDMESVKVVNSRVGRVGSKALTMTGDINVTIMKNVFEKLDRQALKVAVTGTVNFDQNIIRSWAGDALEGFMCHNRTSLERNTFEVVDDVASVLNLSTTPFHTSCGNPQIFLVITPQSYLLYVADSRGAWVLGGLLAVGLVVLMWVGWRYLGKGGETIYNTTNTGRFTSLLAGRGNNARRTSLENLPRHAEFNVPVDDDEDDDDDMMRGGSGGGGGGGDGGGNKLLRSGGDGGKLLKGGGGGGRVMEKVVEVEVYDDDYDDDDDDDDEKEDEDAKMVDVDDGDVVGPVTPTQKDPS